ncbi:MAG: glycosyltransferase [Candidatus Omnitrophica bacterium]|nr:glycosyltransferase [Candidatus Omnitrophota bacterium]
MRSAVENTQGDTAKKKRSIIVFYISEFGGHSRAAKNIREALLMRDPGLAVHRINGAKYFYPVWERIVDFIYTRVIVHSPHLWGRVYDREKVIRRLSPVRRVVNRLAFGKVKRLLRRKRPDCIVATQAFPCGVIADYKLAYEVDVPLIAVVTDYYPHRFWVHPAITHYVVACPEAKDILCREGVPEEKIKILGIPISVKFLQSFSKEAVARAYGFNPHLPSLLLMGGGLGLGPLKMIAGDIDSLPYEFQIIVVCGRNHGLYQWFCSRRRKFRKPVYCFRYVDFVHELMDFADIIVTKGGGITVSEALAKGLAMLITNPIPGQEERNVAYLARTQAVLRMRNPQEIAEAVQRLFTEKGELYRLKERAKDIAVIDSSVRIVDLILSELRG